MHHPRLAQEREPGRTRCVDSPGQSYSRMLLDIYHAAKDAAAAVTKVAGGLVDSDCWMGLPVRAVPGSADLVASSRTEMADGLSGIIHVHRHMDVGHPDTRRFAATLERTAPHMSTFIGRPGIPGSANDIERAIRKYVVRPRNIRRILPDWAAARTLKVLQMVHAACRIRGNVLGRCRRGNPRLLGVRVRQAAAHLRASLSGPTDVRGRTARVVAAYGIL